MLMWLHAGTPEREDTQTRVALCCLPGVSFFFFSLFVFYFLLKERHCGYPTRFQMCNHYETTILTLSLLWSTVHNSFMFLYYVLKDIVAECALCWSSHAGVQLFQASVTRFCFFFLLFFWVNALYYKKTAASAMYQNKSRISYFGFHFIISFQYFMDILVITVKAGWVFFKFYLWRYIEKRHFFNMLWFFLQILRVRG